MEIKNIGGTTGAMDTMDTADTLKVKETAEKYLYTYKEYAAVDDDNRYELIDGIAYMMASPSSAHQRISSELHGRLWQFLRGRTCEVFATLDVRLNADSYDDTVVQPDILVVCDKSKIDNRGILGAPDLVIEILSRSTATMDFMRKFYLYQTSGVKEYWIIDPGSKTISVMILENNEYLRHVYSKKDKIKSVILKGFKLTVNEIFDNLVISEEYL